MVTILVLFTCPEPPQPMQLIIPVVRLLLIPLMVTGTILQELMERVA